MLPLEEERDGVLDGDLDDCSEEGGLVREDVGVLVREE